MRHRCNRLRAALLAAFAATVLVTPALADCEGRKPILYLAFSSSEGYMDAVTMTDFADRVVANHLKNLPGVADVAMFGERRLILRIRLDLSRLAAYGAAPTDVEDALRHQGIALPAGRTDPGTIDLPVSFTDANPLQGLDSVVVREGTDYAVRLMDVAQIEQTTGGAHTVAHYAGKDVIALGVVSQPDTGALAIWYAVSRTLATIRPMMPPDLQVDLVSPFSIVIQRARGG